MITEKCIPNGRSKMYCNLYMYPVTEPRRHRQVREWVKVKHSGPRMTRVAIGSQMEIECEANGSPPPSVQWLHGVHPVSQVSSVYIFIAN